MQEEGPFRGLSAGGRGQAWLRRFSVASRASSSTAGPSSWKRVAAATAATRVWKSGGTSADSAMAMRSSRCSRSGPSSGLYVAISSGLHLGRHLKPQHVAAESEMESELGDFIPKIFHRSLSAC